MLEQEETGYSASIGTKAFLLSNPAGRSQSSSLGMAAAFGWAGCAGCVAAAFSAGALAGAAFGVAGSVATVFSAACGAAVVAFSPEAVCGAASVFSDGAGGSAVAACSVAGIGRLTMIPFSAAVSAAAFCTCGGVNPGTSIHGSGRPWAASAPAMMFPVIGSTVSWPRSLGSTSGTSPAASIEMSRKSIFSGMPRISISFFAKSAHCGRPPLAPAIRVRPDFSGLLSSKPT